MSRPIRAALGLAAAILVTIAAAGPAHASAYRYWTYWTGSDGEWSFATAGPAFLIPADGSVQGWRFAVTTAAGSAAVPRSPASFDEICADTPPQDGKKRVALVVDPGDPGEAPPGQSPSDISTTCVVADSDATGYQVLRSVTTVRVDKGLVCGIDGYPTGECAPVVDDPTPETSASASPATSVASAPATPVGEGSAMDTAAVASEDGGSGTPWPLISVIAIATVVAGLLVVRRRRA